MITQNLELPILQAPVEDTVNLAAAVSGTGGMGSLGLTWTETETAARLVDEVISRTSNPFFANFVLSFEPVAFNAVIEAGVPVVTLSWGISSRLIRHAHQRGVEVGIQIGTVEAAREAVENGADFLICQGSEAGGHVQSTESLAVLLPRILDCTKDIPVFAAGGLADKEDIDWALHQGAAGVMLGTRFLATQESDAHPLYKEAILAARGSDTVSTKCFDIGWPDAIHRVIRNRLTTAWEEAGSPLPGARPSENRILMEDAEGYVIKTYDFRNPIRSYPIKDVSEWCLYAGLGCDKIDDIPSVETLIQRLRPG